MNNSGFTIEDEVLMATAMYNNNQLSHPRETAGKPFKFIKF